MGVCSVWHSTLAIDNIFVHFNILKPKLSECHLADDIFKCIFLNENVWIPIKISLKFVPKGLINNIPALVQIMAWRRPGDKPWNETHCENICPGNMIIIRDTRNQENISYSGQYTVRCLFVISIIPYDNHITWMSYIIGHWKIISWYSRRHSSSWYDYKNKVNRCKFCNCHNMEAFVIRAFINII